MRKHSFTRFNLISLAVILLVVWVWLAYYHPGPGMRVFWW